ncbi:MAG TPA: ferritin-like domain-containing protein [Blastocatellia bacterium]|nr:ferritin-like domain-containing protein [Blastocatellia bacterium]
MTSNANNTDPTGWTPDLVREYVSGAARLEMWTIPLYLCVAFSIKNPDNPAVPISLPQALQAVEKANLTGLEYSEAIRSQLASDSGLLAKFAFYSILTVGIQEMLHTELASNVCNAIGGTVDFTGAYSGHAGSLAPVYDAAHVPYIDVPSSVAPLVKLGPLDKDSIALLQWVEHYAAPSGTSGPQEKYDTIGDFYQSVQSGLNSLWKQLYPQTGSPTPAQLKQKNDWQTKVQGQIVEEYSFSITISGDSDTAKGQADQAIAAIVSQGEGGSGDHIAVNPAFRMKDGNKVEIVFDTFTHWERFTIIKDLMDLGVKIQTWQAESTPPDPVLLAGLQQAMRQSLSSFLDALTKGFNTTNALNLDAMWDLGTRMYEVWMAGGVPDFTYDVYTAPQYPHACQGLNDCAGQGAPETAGGAATGTQVGDGYCATAWFHTCGTDNQCTSQGGCGYALTSNVNDFTKNWIPNENGCNGLGGCGAPIPEKQAFNSSGDSAAPQNFPDGSPCRGASVWERARVELAKRHGKNVNDLPNVETNALRKALSPTAS